jgi:uncharacterized protein (TIGR02757 family)
MSRRSANDSSTGRSRDVEREQQSFGRACKRLNRFLRWVVRTDSIDLGVWTRVSPLRLIVPLDTHVVCVGRCLRLTRYL